MSFDLAIWRRSPTTKTAMIVEVYESLEQRDHPAAALFDTEEFVDAACAKFGRLELSDPEMAWIPISEEGGGSVGVSLYPWVGSSSACVHVSGPFDASQATISALLPLVIERNLMLYDAQAQVVYNNRRSYSD